MQFNQDTFLQCKGGSLLGRCYYFLLLLPGCKIKDKLLQGREGKLQKKVLRHRYSRGGEGL